MQKQQTVREPLFHLAKRDNVSTKYKIGVKALAIFLALLTVIILTCIMAGVGPIEVVKKLCKGAFGSYENRNLLFYNMAMLLGIAVALVPAYKMKFWNVGAQGQVLMGALFASIVVWYIGGGLPNWLTLIFMLVAACIGGGLWAIIPAIFKVKYNSNETLFTLMMNYIAIKLVYFFTDVWKGKNSALDLFKTGFLPKMFGNYYGLTFLAIILITVLITLYVKYTKHGYELSVVGESINTANYAGMNTKKIILRTIALSGIICGIVGFLYVGNDHSVSVEAHGVYGFTAIIVTWASNFNPIAMAIISFLIVFLETGAKGIYNVSEYHINAFISKMYVGIFLFFLIGCEFFIGYKLLKNKKKKKEQEKKEQKDKEVA